LEVLAHLYYPTVASLGEFVELAPDQLPATPRELLAHDKHMTVAVESFHGSPVNVVVLDSRTTENHYIRKILLTRTRDDCVVMFGIVRIMRCLLSEVVREKIEGEQIPLGRILIEHNVMRNVRLLSLWKMTPGPDIQRLFGLDRPQTCFGRTALLYLDTLPVIELLEIVTPT
jgi:chorismate-pyruvate lyase